MSGAQWLLCADGEWPPESVWRPLSGQCGVIIGVDGGTDAAISRNIAVTGSGRSGVGLSEADVSKSVFQDEIWVFFRSENIIFEAH